MIREEDKLDDRNEKMKALRKILETIEMDRLDGKIGCSIEELDAYLEKIMEEE